MITIEKPVIKDLRGIQEVFYLTWLATYPDEEAGITVADIEEFYKNRFSKEALARRAENIANRTADKLFLVARDKEKVVGVCWLAIKPDHNSLEAIYVLPGYQGKGIGRKFWQEALDFFDRDKDITVEVATFNKGAIAFYERLGFIDTGRRFAKERFKMPVSGALIPEMEMAIKAGKMA